MKTVGKFVPRILKLGVKLVRTFLATDLQSQSSLFLPGKSENKIDMESEY